MKRTIALFSIFAALIIALAIPGCANLSPSQAVSRIELVRGDLHDVTALLDPVADADSIKALADVERGLAAVQEGLAAYQGDGEVSSLLDRIDLVAAQLETLFATYGDENNSKHRRIRVVLIAVRLAVRHVRASVEAGAS